MAAHRNPSREEEEQEEHTLEEEQLHLFSELLVEMGSEHISEFSETLVAIDTFTNKKNKLAEKIGDFTKPEEFQKIQDRHQHLTHLLEKKKKKDPKQDTLTVGMGKWKIGISDAALTHHGQILHIAEAVHQQIDRGVVQTKLQSASTMAGMNAEAQSTFIPGYESWKEKNPTKSVEDYIFKQHAFSKEQKNKLSNDWKQARATSLETHKAMVARAQEHITLSLHPSTPFTTDAKEFEKQLEWVLHGEAKLASPDSLSHAAGTGTGSAEMDDLYTEMMGDIPETPAKKLSHSSFPLPSPTQDSETLAAHIASEGEGHTEMDDLYGDMMGDIPAPAPTQSAPPPPPPPPVPPPSLAPSMPSANIASLASEIPAASRFASFSSGFKNMMSSMASKFSGLTSKLSSLTGGLGALASGVMGGAKSLIGSGISSVGTKLLGATAFKSMAGAVGALGKLAGGPIATAIFLANDILKKLMGIDLINITLKYAVLTIVAIVLGMVFIMMSGSSLFPTNQTKIAHRQEERSISWDTFEQHFLVTEFSPLADSHPQESWEQFVDTHIISSKKLSDSSR